MNTTVRFVKERGLHWLGLAQTVICEWLWWKIDEVIMYEYLDDGVGVVMRCLYVGIVVDVRDGEYGS